jgi:uncharacterized membrane protein
MAAKTTKPAKAKDEDVNMETSSHRIKSKLEFNKTNVDHVSLFITGILGSMKFLCTCLGIFLLWILWNTNHIPGLVPFDPYPFPGLEMGVSIFAIVLSISVLISQNRQGRMEKIRQQVEFEVNILAENEVTKVLTMLHEIQKKMGINSRDRELEEMKENIDIDRLHKEVDDIE